MGETHEPRRGARIAASFWIGLEGIDASPTLRQGNLSASGMYFETEASAGPTGSVQFLHIASEDRSVVVQVLARIIRITNIDDIVRGQSIGLAMEFMPSSLEGRHNLERLVRHVVELGLRQEETVDHSFDVELVGEHHADRTTLQHLSVQKVVLETDWRARVGDQLEFQICSPLPVGGPFPLEGQVTKVKPVEEGYRVEIRVTGMSRRPRADTERDEVEALADMLAQPIEDFALPARDHLSGLLSRIKLPSLLGLLEMERMSGELSFTGPGLQEALLFVRDGRLVDARSAQLAGGPRDILGTLMRWEEGQFQFAVESVECEDTLGCSMTSLILDLAREEDESREAALDDGDTDFF